MGRISRGTPWSEYTRPGNARNSWNVRESRRLSDGRKRVVGEFRRFGRCARLDGGSMRGAERSAPLVALALTAAALAATPAAAPETSVATRLAGRAMGVTPLLSDLADLCAHVGGRPTGSAACERAVDWAASRFRAAGVGSVSLESFTLPSLWLPEAADGECVVPEKFPLRLTAAPFSAS